MDQSVSLIISMINTILTPRPIFLQHHAREVDEIMTKASEAQTILLRIQDWIIMVLKLNTLC